MSKLGNSVLILGTSDGVVSPSRAHASILLSIDGRCILFDCGEPCSHSLVKRGVPADLVDAIYLSHLHSDHVGGFPMVIQWFWLANRTKTLPIYLPKEGVEPIRNYLNTVLLFEELMKFKMNLIPLRAKKPMTVRGLNVTCCNNSHLESLKESFGKMYPQNKFESFSLRVEGKSASIVYSGDVGTPLDLIPLLQRRTDVLIVELAHFEPITLFEFLSSYKIHRIIFTHLGGFIQRNLEKTKKLAGRYFKNGQCIFAEDGLRLKF
ncbi:MAG: ribonuclease Z [Verrucomicrobiae bacterium]|nr:ribonuclease Z [Verrucomicrobiae bacterium]